MTLVTSFHPDTLPALSLSTLPSDVLCEIALTTLQLGCDIPTLADLSNIVSLVLTCRRTYYSLCMANNPDMYAQIFRLMFDLKAVRRRLGRSAVASSVLALELKHRVVMLNSIKTGSDNSVAVMARASQAYLVMLENYGKNGYQLDVVRISCFLNDRLAFAMESGVENRAFVQDPVLRLGLALMWLTSSTGDIMHSLVKEGSARHVEILNFLAPFVLRDTAFIMANEDSHTCAAESISGLKLDYFGRVYNLNVPSVTVLSRLCTVDRYNVSLYHIQANEQPVQCTVPSASSTRYDADWLQFLDPSPVLAGSPGLTAIRSFEGNWEGNLLMSHPTERSTRFTCAQPMQCWIREYHSFVADGTVSFVEDKDNPREVLASAWFPEGVDFYETPESLMIYDTMKSRWFRYMPRSDAHGHSRGQIPSDTILIGNTDPAHGAIFGEYKFYGRIRAKDGCVTLVRTPANPQASDQELLVLRGFIYGGMDFVGDWKVVSRGNQSLGRKCWVHLARVKVTRGEYGMSSA